MNKFIKSIGLALVAAFSLSAEGNYISDPAHLKTGTKNISATDKQLYTVYSDPYQKADVKSFTYKYSNGKEIYSSVSAVFNINRREIVVPYSTLDKRYNEYRIRFEVYKPGTKQLISSSSIAVFTK